MAIMLDTQLDHSQMAIVLVALWDHNQKASELVFSTPSVVSKASLWEYSSVFWFSTVS